MKRDGENEEMDKMGDRIVGGVADSGNKNVVVDIFCSKVDILW